MEYIMKNCRNFIIFANKYVNIRTDVFCVMVLNTGTYFPLAHKYFGIRNLINPTKYVTY